MVWSNEIFAKNLKYYMDREGINQKELADIVNVSAPTVNDWVKAKKYPRIDKIEILSNYFGILKSDLIEDKEEMRKNNDIMVDIVDRLMDNPSVLPLINKILEDPEFLSLVKCMYDLDGKQIAGVMQMLNSFRKI